MSSPKVHVGTMLDGRITDTIPVTSLRWADTLNGAGSIDVTVTEDVVRKHQLREKTHGARSFLAVERDGRIKQAGPIWTRRWDWRKGVLSLGAGGLWTYFDHRVVQPAATEFSNSSLAGRESFTATGKSLGGLVRALLERCLETAGSPTTVILPADETGDHTETFPMWQLLRVGEQVRQITQRATEAPDVAFRAQRRTADPRFMDWPVRIGTVAAPTLSQGGTPWVIDATAPNSEVRGTSAAEDATGMAQQVYVTGNGMEEDILFASAFDLDLLNKSWVLTEEDDAHHTVEDQATLEGHADALLGRVARPIESFKVTVSADAAREVVAGDFARLVLKNDAWLGDVDRLMRIRQVVGTHGDDLELEMFPTATVL